MLFAAMASGLSLIGFGCSVTGDPPDHGGGGRAPTNHGGGAGLGGGLFETSSADAATSASSGGAGRGHGGAGGADGSGITATAGSTGGPGGGGLGTASGGGVTGSASSVGGSASSASASSAAASTSGATSGAGGADPIACDPTEIIDTSPAVPVLLSATGLYQDIATKTLAADVLPFTPQYPLWTDGAEKSRWVHLPGCAKIDTTDMDRWAVPVGTKIWKEFAFGGVRVETRYLHRWGPGSYDFVFQAYQWNADGLDAEPVPIGGSKNANGTTHDIPGEWECEVCHGHSPERVLGLSAFQLSHAGPGLTVASLSAMGRLTVPTAGYTVPGNATARAALGYLHGNCAHCHNPSPKAVWFPTPFSLKLLTAAATVAQTDAFLTAVGVVPEKFVHPGITHRITAADPASSCVDYRMSVRGSTDEMPALGSEIVDQAGLAAVTAWITELPP